jgi:DNA-binding NarL/FixJ family response regulator
MGSIPELRFGAAAAKPYGHKRSVFLLYCHPLVREWLARLINLQSDLSVCGEAEEADEALAGIIRQLPDVVVIDSMLLETSATKLISELSRVGSPMKVVVFSVYEDDQDARRAMLAGAGGYVNCSARIVPAIRRVLEGKPFLS